MSWRRQRAGTRQKKREQRPVGVKAPEQKERRSGSLRKRDKAREPSHTSPGDNGKALGLLREFKQKPD